jgi:hypothetical protein
MLVWYGVGSDCTGLVLSNIQLNFILALDVQGAGPSQQIPMR